MKATSVFSKNWKAYREGAKVIANKGSTRSSKTWSELQIAYLIASNSKIPLTISIVSRTLVHLKSSAIRDFDTILKGEGVDVSKIKHGTDHNYKIGECLIDYFGADQSDRVHGPGRDILIMIEANFIKWEIADQLIQRTDSTIFIDFNPSIRFWLQDELVKNEPVHIIKSTYKDNEYCPEGIKKRLNLKLDRYYREKNAGTITRAYENYCKVYLFGEDGSFEGAIFENWRYESPGEVEMKYKELSYGYGLDYGFHPDPDAMVKVAIDTRRKIIYAKECVHQTNNGTEDLRKQIQEHVKGKELIVAESATPRISHDLSSSFNISRVRKTKTVADWLRILQDYEIVITEGSYNLEKELGSYQWSDKKAGIPIDDWNHLIDALRYYAMNILQPGPGMRKR